MDQTSHGPLQHTYSGSSQHHTLKTVSMNTDNTNTGNVLFLILIAVALFAGLGYAVTNSLNSAPIKVEEEKQSLDQAVLNNCEAAINLALLRLESLGNCANDEINYELPDGSNSNPNAPADGHCNVFHPAYGGASPCGILTDPSCDFSTLSVGEDCNGIVYAGESGGNRIYTTRADHGGTNWNNGTSNWVATGATSASDGTTNTDTLVALSDIGSPYRAAQICRAYGPDWYLPSKDELNVLYLNRYAIGGFDTTTGWSRSYYWSSSEYSDSIAYYQKFSASVPTPLTTHDKTYYFYIRCIRQI